MSWGIGCKVGMEWIGWFVLEEEGGGSYLSQMWNPGLWFIRSWHLLWFPIFNKLWAFHSFIHQVTYRAIHPHLLYFIHLVTYRAIHPNLLYFIHLVTYRAIHTHLIYFIHHLFNCSVKLNYSFNIQNLVAEVPGGILKKNLK